VHWKRILALTVIAALSIILFVHFNSEDNLSVFGDWLVHSFGDFPRSSFSQDGVNWIDAPASFVVSGYLGPLFLGVDEFQSPALLEPNGAIRPARLPNNMTLQRLQTYDSWSNGHFGESNPDNEFARQPDADPDFDGRRNLFEFLMGANPLSADESIVFEYEIENDNLKLRYQNLFQVAFPL